MFKVIYSANGMDWEHSVYASKADAEAGMVEAMEMPLVDRAWIVTL